MQYKRKVLAISGSLRKKSINKIVLKHLAKYFEKELEIENYDIGKLPHFNPDIENKHTPQKIQEFQEKIKTADALLISTPEYVFSIPSILKNAIEWNVSSTYLSNKPTAFIIASASGEKAYTSLELILKTVETNIAEDSKLLIKGAKGIINDKGEITNIEVVKKLKKLGNSLIKTIEENKTTKTPYDQ